MSPALTLGSNLPADGPVIPAHIVAACDRIRSTLNWHSNYDNLQIIVAHALAWERKLAMRPARDGLTVRIIHLAFRVALRNSGRGMFERALSSEVRLIGSRSLS